MKTSASLFIASVGSLFVLACEPKSEESATNEKLPEGKAVTSKEANDLATANLRAMATKAGSGMAFAQSSDAMRPMTDASEIFLGVGDDDVVVSDERFERSSFAGDLRAARVLPRAHAHLRTTLARAGRVRGINRLIARDFLHLAPSADFGDFEEQPREVNDVGDDVRQLSDDLSQFLAEKVFLDDQLESDKDGESIYLIKGEIACLYHSSSCWDDGKGGEGCEEHDELDQECADVVNAGQIRVGARKIDNDTLGLRLLVGPDRAESIRATLAPSEIDVTLDLAGALASSKHLESVSPDSGSFPGGTASGKYHWNLSAASDSIVHMQTGIAQAVAVQGEVDGESFVVELAKSDPCMDVTIDSQKREIAMEMNYGTIRAEIPFGSSRATSSDSDEGGRSTDSVAEVFLAGLQASTTLNETSDVSRLNGVWIGDQASYFAIDDVKVFSIEASNANKNRADFEVSPVSSFDDLPIAALHDFDLSISYAQAPGEFSEDWIASIAETVTVKVGGGSPTAAAFNYDHLRMIDGTLQISSDAGAAVDIAKDTCVVFILPDAGESMIDHVETIACQ